VPSAIYANIQEVIIGCSDIEMVTVRDILQRERVFYMPTGRALR